MNSRDLKNMDNAQLLTMQNSIKKEIESRFPKVDILFREAQDKSALSEKHYLERNSLANNQSVSNLLQDIGFLIVLHDDYIFIMAYGTKEITGKDTGFNLYKDGNLTNTNEDLHQEDFKKVKQILGVK